MDDLDPADFGNLDGDFYREPDDVMRGVSMAAPLGSMEYNGIGEHFCAGYPELGGMGNAGGFYGEPHLGGLGLAGDSDDPGNCMDTREQLAKSPSGDIGAANAQGGRRFPETAVPPCIRDPLYTFDEATTLHMTLDKQFEPSKIGNDILGFLEKQVGSSVLKVNPTKFAIKARVFVDGHMCTLKAKVFSKGGRNYAVEVQRRSGDAIVFVAAFQQVAKYLLTAGKEVYLPSPRVAAAPTPMDVEHDWPVAPLLDPLLDLAGFGQLPGLQAEAAIAFVKLASEPETATALCCDAAFDKILALLHHGEEAIAFPATQALLHLTTCNEAKSCLSRELVLLSIVQKVSSKASCLAVRTQLAKVVSEAVQSCLDCFTATAKKQLAKALAKAVDELNGPEVQASQHLILAREKLVQY